MTEEQALRGELATVRGLYSRLLWDAKFINGDLALGRINNETHWVNEQIGKLEKRLKELKE